MTQDGNFFLNCFNKKKVSLSYQFSIQEIKMTQCRPKEHVMEDEPHHIVRNFKSMYCIANMFDLRNLAKFS